MAAAVIGIISKCTLTVENPAITAKTTDNSEQSMVSEKGEKHDPNINSCEVVSPPAAEEGTLQEQPVNSEQSMVSDKQDKHDPNINSSEVVSPPAAEEETSQEPPVKKLSVDQKEAIEEIFGHLIRSTNQILTSDVKEGMKNGLSLRALLPFPNKVKKVVDRIRSLQRLHLSVRKPSVQPGDLPTSQPQEATHQWLEKAESLASSSASTRMDWSEEENVVIMKHFGMIKEHPQKKFVAEAFNTIDELKALLEAKGFQRCYDKVKNTFKKIKKQKK